VAGRSGERFISPGVQREQIAGWVGARGYLLGEVFEELDESGARGDRPLLEEAVSRVERGDSQGIVVAKIDRFGRSLMNGLAAIERVTDAGGIFASVQDGLDLSTDTGRLVLRIMLSMGEWELDRVRANWAVACGRAIARGVHVGTVPFGYRRRDDGRLLVDPSPGQSSASSSGAAPTERRPASCGPTCALRGSPRRRAACGVRTHCGASLPIAPTSGSSATGSRCASAPTPR
jgi:Resolvase, N terminal domain